MTERIKFMTNKSAYWHDIANAVCGTTNDNVMIGTIADIFDWCIDGEKTGKSAQMFETQIQFLENYGISINSLYRSCLAHGASPQRYPMSELDVIRQWLLPAYNPWCQLSTHLGWTAPACHPSWLVKRDLLVNLIRGIYGIDPIFAERVAATCYCVHIVRDTELNAPCKEFRNVIPDMRKYALPLLKNSSLLYEQLSNYIDLYEDNLEIALSTGDRDGVCSIIRSLLGSEYGAGGILTDVISNNLSLNAKKRRNGND
jgi:hypothetical protein